MGKVLKSNEELLKQAIGFYSKSKRKKTSSIKDLRIKENEGTRMVDFDEINGNTSEWNRDPTSLHPT